MPRGPRLEIPGVPHHVIQRGNRGQRTFFCDQDLAFYLRLLEDHLKEFGVDLWAYCLMTNHVHFVAVPRIKGGLAKAFGETHRVYTRWINLREKWRGYFWQGRFKSYPMDEYRLFVAVRYIELNPVRAGIVERPEDYLWSSARNHILGPHEALLCTGGPLQTIADWRAFLEAGVEETDLVMLRKHNKTGLPLGSEAFVTDLEAMTGRVLHERKRGKKADKS
jgi:putative transposase